MQRYSVWSRLDLREDGDVVRYEDARSAIDAVLNEAIWAMDMVVDRIRYRNDLPQQTFNELEVLCMKDRNYRRAIAFLDSQAVRDYRARQAKP